MHSHRPYIRSYAIEETDFDADEIRLIEVARIYFICFSKGELPDFRTSVELCRNKLGRQNAADIAACLFNVTSAMREARSTVFQFNSSTCKHCRSKISECELQLFSVLHKFRKGDRKGAMVCAMISCEGNDMKQFLTEIEQLSGLLPHYHLH